MPEIKFPSEWLKIDINVNHGDNIQFLNVGEFDEEREQWIFNIGIVKEGEVVEQKKFSLNKSNFEAIKSVYGINSDKWVNKEMRVNKVKVRNPKGGMVDSILLSSPNTDEEGNIIIQ